MIFYFITSNIHFFSLEKRPLVFLLGAQSEGCTATHFKNYQYGDHNGVFKSYSQKNKKDIFSFTFFVYILSHFTKHFINTLDFLNTFSHSSSLHHSVVVLLLSHFPSKLEFFFNLCQKMTEFFPKLIYKCNPRGYHHKH